MKTIEVNLYKFSELSEEAQQTAIEQYRDKQRGYICEDEYKDTLNAFSEKFPVDTGKWEVGVYSRSYCDLISTAREEVEQLTGVRLYKYLVNNFGGILFKRKYLGSLKQQDQPHARHQMVKNREIKSGPNKGKFYASVFSNCQTERDYNLTGVYSDYDILKPIYEFLEKPCKHTNFLNLINECGESWAKGFENNIEHENSEEFIIESLLCRDQDYTEDGQEY